MNVCVCVYRAATFNGELAWKDSYTTAGRQRCHGAQRMKVLCKVGNRRFVVDDFSIITRTTWNSPNKVNGIFT